MDITLEQLLSAFAEYNQMLYPAQWVAILIALIAVLFAVIKKPFSNALIIGVAIFFNLFIALALWLPAASMHGYSNGYLFMAIFIVQAGLLLCAALEDELHFHFEPKPLPIIGMVFVLYGLLGYPLIGMLVNRAYPGLIFSPFAPCPMNIWFIGMLLMTDKPVPRFTLIIPFIWGLIGVMWAAIGVTEDIGLVITNLIGPALLCIRDRGKRVGLHY